MTKTKAETQLAYFDRDKLIWGSCLKSNEKLLLHALNSFVGADGRCFPKHNLLAEMTSFSRSSVVRVMKSLEESGVVQVEWRYRPDGSQSSNDYFLDWEALKALNRKGVSNCNRGVSKSNTRVSNSDTGGSNMQHQELINSTTQSTNQLTTQEYTQSISGENADSTFELTGNLSSRGGSKTIDDAASGTASPGNNPDSCGASENDYHSQNEPYAKPWHKDEPLRGDKDGYAVLPPADKHKMPRQTAVKLAQYVLLAENDPSFELMLPDPSDCLDDEYPTDCWVSSKNNCTWYRENELETTEPLRALRNVNEANGGLDFNELLNDCWRAATSLWDEDDALALFKRTPLPVIFEDFLEDYGVEVIDYDFDTLCPL